MIINVRGKLGKSYRVECFCYFCNSFEREVYEKIMCVLCGMLNKCNLFIY